jgi:hypothetical protein
MTRPQMFYGAKPILFRRSVRTAPVLPELVREWGDVLLTGRVLPPRALMLLLRLQVSLIGVLMGLPGLFMPGHVIFLPAVLGAGAMGVCGIAAVLGSYLLRIAHHGCLCTYGTVCRTRPAKAPRRRRFSGLVISALRVQLLHLSRGPEPSTGAFRIWAIPCKEQCGI